MPNEKRHPLEEGGAVTADSMCADITPLPLSRQPLLQHPLSAAFPSMSTADQDALTDDIKANGQRDPITIFDGQVLDGWHRYQACLVLEIEPITVELSADVDPVKFVISRNMHRRHLTGSQRADAVVACSEWAQTGRPEKGEPGSPLKATVPEMAATAEVSERTIQHAKAARSAGLGDKVRSGELTAKAAARLAKPKQKKEPTPAEGMVSVAKEYLEILEQQNAEYKSESEALANTLDAEPDQQLNEAIKKIQQMTARIVGYETRLDGEINKNAELIKIVNSQKRTIAKMEQRLNEYKLQEAER
jgi:hypothetical protein